MSNNQLPLVTYEQARRLKMAVFDWPCEHYYDAYGEIVRLSERHGNDFYVGFYCDCVSAPTVTLALKWLRDVKGKFGELRTCVCSDPVGLLLGWDVVVFGMPAGNPRYGDPAGSFDTYEAAESALLDELLNIIENDCKNKKD